MKMRTRWNRVLSVILCVLLVPGVFAAAGERVLADLYVSSRNTAILDNKQNTEENPFADMDKQYLDVLSSVTGNTSDEMMSTQSLEGQAVLTQTDGGLTGFNLKFKAEYSYQVIYELIKDYTFDMVGKSSNRVFAIQSQEDLTAMKAKFDGYCEYVEQDVSIPVFEDAEHSILSAPDAAYSLMAAPNDPYLSQQWYVPALKANDAWDITTGSDSIYVAVIDSGIDRNQPDLADADIRDGLDAAYSGPCIKDYKGHGTNVSGIIVASMNNNEGIAGIAPDVALVPISIQDNEGNIYVSYITKALYAAADSNCKVINCSFVCSNPSALKSAITYAYNKGCIIIAGAGNDSSSLLRYPASLDGVISVGSVGEHISWSNFSNYNNMVDVVAPGEKIATTDSFPITGYYYCYASGTSFSTPCVAAIAALAASRDPTITPLEFEKLLQTTSTDIGAAGYDVYTGYGIVNAYKLLQTNDQEAIRQKIEAFVTRFYQLCLGREPDPTGLQNWVSNLTNKTQTGADVAYGFVFSDEFKNRGVSDDEFVKIMYRAFFDRDPDPTGYANWMTAISNGMSRYYVLSGFTNSQEFINFSSSYEINAGSLTLTDPVDLYGNITAFVTRFYQQCLGRMPDPTGLHNWVDNLHTGKQTGCDAAYGFVFSDEFQNRNVSNDEFVKIMYKAFFNRDPDPTGYNTWMNDLNSGSSRYFVLAGFVNSQEFSNTCQTYSINSGHLG